MPARDDAVAAVGFADVQADVQLGHGDKALFLRQERMLGGGVDDLVFLVRLPLFVGGRGGDGKVD
nr:hypothetical protein [Dictyobacter arantiisoli]